jgi:uncharacterized protein (DUF934 family)
MKFIDPALDAWQPAPADAAEHPVARRLFTLEHWQAVRDAWPQGWAAGVCVANTVDVETLAGDLPRLALVALEFPKWVDGRAYSQARTLRARLQYRGEVRAVGDVVVDMMPLLARTGFDAVVLRAGQERRHAERGLAFFTEYYQGDVREPRPHFARLAAPADSARARPRDDRRAL